MTTTAKRMILFSSPLAVALIIGTLWYALAGASSPNAATPIPAVPATDAQRQAFGSLVQNYRRTFFDGWLTGDLTKFPAVFYNDAASPPDARLQSLINQNRNQIDTALSNSRSGPVGATTGELAARMADVMWRRQSAAEWQTVQATAAAQGRAPTLKDMPGGQQPVVPVQASDSYGREDDLPQGCDGSGRGPCINRLRSR